jgi:hypothetical protein
VGLPESLVESQFRVIKAGLALRRATWGLTALLVAAPPASVVAVWLAGAALLDTAPPPAWMPPAAFLVMLAGVGAMLTVTRNLRGHRWSCVAFLVGCVGSVVSDLAQGRLGLGLAGAGLFVVFLIAVGLGVRADRRRTADLLARIREDIHLGIPPAGCDRG